MLLPEPMSCTVPDSELPRLCVWITLIELVEGGKWVARYRRLIPPSEYQSPQSCLRCLSPTAASLVARRSPDHVARSPHCYNAVTVLPCYSAILYISITSPAFLAARPQFFQSLVERIDFDTVGLQSRCPSQWLDVCVSGKGLTQGFPVIVTHIPHTVTGAPPSVSSRRYTLSSHDLSSARSTSTRCPSSVAQRSM